MNLWVRRRLFLDVRVSELSSTTLINCVRVHRPRYLLWVCSNNAAFVQFPGSPPYLKEKFSRHCKICQYKVGPAATGKIACPILEPINTSMCVLQIKTIEEPFTYLGSSANVRVQQRFVARPRKSMFVCIARHLVRLFWQCTVHSGSKTPQYLIDRAFLHRKILESLRT